MLVKPYTPTPCIDMEVQHKLYTAGRVTKNILGKASYTTQRSTNTRFIYFQAIYGSQKASKEGGKEGGKEIAPIRYL